LELIAQNVVFTYLMRTWMFKRDFYVVAGSCDEDERDVSGLGGQIY